MSDATAQAIERAGGITQVAHRLKLTPAAVRKWVRRGSVPAARVRTVAELAGVPARELRPDLAAAFAPSLEPSGLAAVRFELPMPPSVNAIWRWLGGDAGWAAGAPRRKRKVVARSEAYERWIEDAGWACNLAGASGRGIGPYVLRLRLPAHRGDLGNYEKAVSDLLQRQRVIRDDAMAEVIVAVRDRGLPPGRIVVEIWPAEDR